MAEALRRAKALADGRRRDTARNYEPRGILAEVQHLNNPEIVISGPAGTGKSRACLEKMNTWAWQYPGMRGLILRKTRASLTESGLVTFERDVLGEGNPIAAGPQRVNRHSYLYPNGSELVVGGLDKPTRVMSTEYDLIYIQEAIELSMDEWESLTTRNRNFITPLQQIIADTNPDKPRHWLKARCDQNATRLLDSRHEDNPRLWDAERGEWTPKGVAYIARLDALTGPRKLRLRYGRWVQAEGVVYENYEPSLHLIDRFNVPSEWRRLRVVDFGYTNPFVCQWWAIDPDGRAYLYREIYMSQRLVEDHARQIVELSAGERIEATIADWDAEDRATLDRHGVPTIPAIKDVSPGIQAVQQRLKIAGDGRPRIFFLRDSVVEADPAMIEAKKPTSTVEEIDGYVWSKSQEGKATRENPVKVDDHGMDGTRYMAAYLESQGRPEDWVIKPR